MSRRSDTIGLFVLRLCECGIRMNRMMTAPFNAILAEHR